MRGYTLLELMTTLLIAAIVVVWAWPALQGFSARQQVKAATITLHRDLVLARSEAMFGSDPVTACPGNIDDGCSGQSDWSTGWLIFRDINRDGHWTVDEPLVRIGQSLAGVRMHYSRSRDRILFGNDGSTPGSNGSMTICGSDGPPGARKLVISNVGRIRRDTAPDMNPENCPERP